MRIIVVVFFGLEIKIKIKIKLVFLFSIADCDYYDSYELHPWIHFLFYLLTN